MATAINNTSDIWKQKSPRETRGGGGASSDLARPPTDKGAVKKGKRMPPQSKQSCRNMKHREQVCHRWAVILAGGDGKRLLPLTRQIYGEDRPKQFCAILSGETLLHQTRRRVERFTEACRTVVVVNKEHERYYLGEFS